MAGTMMKNTLGAFIYLTIITSCRFVGTTSDHSTSRRQSGISGGGDLLRVYRHTPDDYSIDETQCEPVTIPACRRLGYNDTRTSRFMYTENIRAHDVIEYLKLFHNEECEREMLFFLCTIFNPICFANHKTHIFPCRSVCEKMKRNCQSVMRKKFGTPDGSDPWSSVFDCNNLPEYQTDVCIKPNSIVTRGKFFFWFHFEWKCGKVSWFKHTALHRPGSKFTGVSPSGQKEVSPLRNVIKNQNSQNSQKFIGYKWLKISSRHCIFQKVHGNCSFLYIVVGLIC